MLAAEVRQQQLAAEGRRIDQAQEEAVNKRRKRVTMQEALRNDERLAQLTVEQVGASICLISHC